jgi:sialidase-1
MRPRGFNARVAIDQTVRGIIVASSDQKAAGMAAGIAAITARLLIVLLLALPPPRSAHASSSPSLPFVHVFTASEAPYWLFREPSLNLLPSDPPTLLAMAWASLINSTAVGGDDIVSKRSTDGGVTWSPLTVVVRNMSQPSPVYSRRSRRVVLACGGPYPTGVNLAGPNFQLFSTNFGVTWSSPVSIERSLGELYGHSAPIANGLELFTGKHKGRLLWIGHRGAYNEDSVWWTDDGATYNATQQTLARGTGVSLNATCGGRVRSCGMDEAQLVQNTQGTIIANMRHMESLSKGRGIATSTDGGATFSAVRFDPQLNTPTSESSIFRSPQNGKGKRSLFLSFSYKTVTLPRQARNTHVRTT